MNFERDLENDGIFDKLYHYLWKFSDYFKEENARLKINIPHTIIFENLQPSFWYFSGDKDFIMKKKHESLCLDNIKSTFLTNISKSGIVAYFIFKKNDKKTTTIEYFDKNSFLNFLDENIDKYPSGILQRFIDPQNEKNSTYQAVYSENVCVFSKKTNFNNIYNKKFDIFERVTTFDGPDYLSEESSVKGKIAIELTDACNKIKYHISELSYDRINIIRMILYFKEDKHGKLIFLYATSIRLTHKKNFSKYFTSKPLALSEKIELSENIINKKTINFRKPLILKKVIKCLNCNKPNTFENFVEVDYNSIIKENIAEKISPRDYFDRLKFNDFKNLQEIVSNSNGTLLKSMGPELKYSKSNNDEIPIIIRKLYPKLCLNDYKKLILDLNFKKRNVYICTECFINLHKNKEKPTYQKFKKPINHLSINETNKLNKKIEIQFENEKKIFINKINKISTREKNESINTNNTLCSTQRTNTSNTDKRFKLKLNLRNIDNYSINNSNYEEYYGNTMSARLYNLTKRKKALGNTYFSNENVTKYIDSENKEFFSAFKGQKTKNFRKKIRTKSNDIFGKTL